MSRLRKGKRWFESKGERRLAQALRDRLPEQWIVVMNYQLPIRGRTRELDAIVVYTRGVVVIEHKDWGGRIEFKRRRVFHGDYYLGPDPRDKLDDNAKKLRGWIEKNAKVSVDVVPILVLRDGAALHGVGEEHVRVCTIQETVDLLLGAGVDQPGGSHALTAAQIDAVGDCLIEDLERGEGPFEVGGYHIVGRVEGDPFEEYWATHARGQRVRLKRFEMDDVATPAQREAEIGVARRMHDVLAKLERLNNPVLPRGYTVIDDLEDETSFWLVYEGIEGVPLDRAVGLEPDEKVRALVDVAEALAVCHDAQVLHRALSPDCILIESGTGRPRLIHFEYARYAEKDSQTIMSRIASVLQDLPRAAPEVRSNPERCSPASDIYSLGLVVAEVLAGRRLDDATGCRALLADVRPRAAKTVIERMTATRPSQRFSSMREVAEALEATSLRPQAPALR